MRAIQLAVACVAVLIVAVAPAEANMIVNGSFEDPTVPSGGFINYPAGATAITGWTVVGVDSSVVSGTFTQSGIVFQAQDGNQWVDLAGVTSNSMSSGVTQDFATMIGVVYELSFYVGSATDNSIFFASTVDLSINGGVRVGYTNPTALSNMLDWRLFTVEFTATSSTTNLTFFNGSAPNNFLSALDNVSVRVLCPCPGDMNADGFKDGRDIPAFINCFLAPGECACANVDGVGGIDSNDTDMLVSDLLNGVTCP